MEQTELDAAKSRAFDAIARMVGMTHYPANEILHGVRAEIDMTVQKYGQPDTAPPPPTEAQENGEQPHSDLYEAFRERVRLLAEMRDEHPQGSEIYGVYQHGVETVNACWTMVEPFDAELATLRTRLEAAEEALRAMLKLLTDAEDAGFDLYRISILVTRLRALLPPSPGAAEECGEEGGGS